MSDRSPSEVGCASRKGVEAIRVLLRRADLLAKVEVFETGAVAETSSDWLGESLAFASASTMTFFALAVAGLEFFSVARTALLATPVSS